MKKERKKDEERLKARGDRTTEDKMVGWHY